MDYNTHDHTLVLIVRPNPPEDDGEAFVAVTADENQLRRRQNEAYRLERALVNLGFHIADWEAFSKIELEGRNWEASASVTPLWISDTNIKLLEGRIEEVAMIRQQALAKLTPVEQASLGLLHRKWNEKKIYADAYREGE